MNSKTKSIVFGVLLLSSSLVVAGHRRQHHRGSRAARRSSGSPIQNVDLSTLPEKLEGFRNKAFVAALIDQVGQDGVMDRTAFDQQARGVGKGFCLIPGKAHQVSQAQLTALMKQLEQRINR